MITDIHMHIIPDVDDGSKNIEMSLEMLRMAYQQGVRNIFCTSHSGYDTERYKSAFDKLKTMAKTEYLDINLYTGCEVLCAEYDMSVIIKELSNGDVLPLADTKYVLTELYTDTTPCEAETVISALIENGWKPVLAHVERYPALFDDNTIERLVSMGAKIQVNAYSLEEENNPDIKSRARYLVNSRYAAFIGSDAHCSNHRPPVYESGVKYIFDNCDKEYAEAITYKNGLDLIGG